MMSNPENLLAWISADTPIWSALPKGEDADAAMDRRDEPETTRAWLRENKAIREKIERTPFSSDLKSEIELIAKRAFIKAFEASPHHDLAAQVSDDLRLIAEAAAVGYESETVAALWKSYAEGRFPENLT